MVGVKNMVRVQLVIVAAALWVIKGIVAETFTVGDDSGWLEPTSSTFYADWASKYTFNVGDVLDFQWTGSHTVAEVTKDAYDGCTLANPIALHQTSPVNIALNSTGDKYYICTIRDHCANGQKLGINVSGSSSSAPPPEGTPPTGSGTGTGSGTDTGSGSGSTTGGATSLNFGIFITFMFFVLGLLC